MPVLFLRFIKNLNNIAWNLKCLSFTPRKVVIEILYRTYVLFARFTCMITLVQNSCGVFRKIIEKACSGGISDAGALVSSVLQDCKQASTSPGQDIYFKSKLLSSCSIPKIDGWNQVPGCLEKFCGFTDSTIIDNSNPSQYHLTKTIHMNYNEL